MPDLLKNGVSLSEVEGELRASCNVDELKTELATAAAQGTPSGFYFGYDEDDLDKFLRTNQCEKCDLALVDLKDMNLSKASLREADLFGAKLSRADLSEAELVEVNLIEADLSQTNLINANLIGTDLWGAILIGADLRGAKLNGAVLDYADLEQVKFCNTAMSDGSIRNDDC